KRLTLQIETRQRLWDNFATSPDWHAAVKHLNHDFCTGEPMPKTWSQRVLWAIFPFLLCLSALGQITVQGGTLEQNTPSAKDSEHPSQTTVEFDMTPDQAAHLLASVDEVIAFDSKVTGLPAPAHV